jgi:hypothetical protein
MNEQWMSIVEYARSFNISDMTVRRRIRTGRIQAVLREGKYYIPVANSQGHLKSSAPRANLDTPNPFRTAATNFSTPEAPALRPQAKHIGSTHLSERPASGSQTADSFSSKGMQGYSSSTMSESHTPAARHYESARPSSESRLNDNNMMAKLMQIVHDDNKKLADKLEKVYAICSDSTTALHGVHEKIEQSFRGKINTLETILSSKEAEIEQLNQKIQDLQLLISILERRSS